MLSREGRFHVTRPVAARRPVPPVRSRVLWAVSPPVLRGIGRTFFALEVEHESPIPEAPFVVAANHYSHFDPPAIAAVLDVPVRFLALEDLFVANRPLEWLITGFGAIPTPRFRSPVGAVRTALSALESGQVVGVFPEGTRVSHWGTLPPKRGAAWLAKRAGVPLLPVAVLGTGRAFGLDNDLRKAPIRITVGRAMPTDDKDVDIDQMTRQWSEWMSAQVARYPSSEVSGPRRAEFDGS